jgi:hypothetical protein
MKFLEDIWSSVVGNATTIVRDPVIGKNQYSNISKLQGV